MEKLALLGGNPAVPKINRKVDWPLIDQSDRDAVERVFQSKKFTSMAQGEEEVVGLEEEWAKFIGAKYCSAVSNGTSALHLALSVLEVEPSDEVIVPSLSFIASAYAPLYHSAIPIFVDIDDTTFNIDVNDLKSKISNKTKCIIVVHLHGLPANMEEIMEIARKNNIYVIEDAAQAHGAVYKGKTVGTIGDISTFSLNVSKNLPTCGEGGLITTNNKVLYEKIMMQRQFGEKIEGGRKRDYYHYSIGWNYKINPIQAAFARSQLDKFSLMQEKRNENISSFLDKLKHLPGVTAPVSLNDRTHAWHILRFKFNPKDYGFNDIEPGQFRMAIKKAMGAEGVPLVEYQHIPLSGHKVFQGDLAHPWNTSRKKYEYNIMDNPKTLKVIENSLTIQRNHLNPNSGELLQRYAHAFEKVLSNSDFLYKVSKSMEFRPQWADLLNKG